MNRYSGYDRYRYDEYTVLGRITSPEEHFVQDARSPKQEKRAPENNEKPRVGRKMKGKVLLTVLITVFAFSLTLFAADLLSGKSGIAEYAALFTKSKQEESVSYYAVYAMQTEDMSLAYKNASAVRAEGGAGYVLKDQDRFYVILNVYSSENDAKVVAEKEVNYAVYEMRIPLPKKNDDHLSFFESTADLYMESYEVLYQAANDLASGKYGEEDMKRSLEKQRERIAAKQEVFAESIRGKENTARIEYKVFLSEIKSAFDNLASDSKNLVADARYYSVMILHSYALYAEKYFA